MTKTKDKETVEDLESQEFLTALSNGNNRLGQLIDLRFRAQAARSRKQHGELISRIDTIEGTMLQIAWLRWLPRLAMATPPLAGLVTGVLRLTGVW